MNSKLHASKGRDRNNAAFTLIELLVVLAVLALLAATLLPALAHTQPDSRAFRCLNNQRQLAMAWRMYAEDNNDYLAANDFPYLTPINAILPRINAANWAPGAMGTGDGTNVSILKDPSISQLFNYLKTVDVFKCPADQSIGLRSVSMNSAVGTRWYGETGPNKKGSRALSGGWLPGVYNENQTTWLTYGKFSSIVRPSPAGLFLIIDEHPDSINNSSIGIPAVPYILVDYPASYHDGGAGIVFTDGHTELHKWQDPRTKVRITGIYNSVPPIGPSPNNVDTVWLSQRTSALR